MAAACVLYISLYFLVGSVGSEVPFEVKDAPLADPTSPGPCRISRISELGSVMV